MQFYFNNKKTDFKNGLLYRWNNWKKQKKYFKKALNKRNKSYSDQVLTVNSKIKNHIKNLIKNRQKWLNV